MLQLDATSVVIVAVVAALAVGALALAAVLARQVLAADEGTVRMQDIARAVQEGASAFLRRQLRTLSLFAVVVVGLLFLLPGDAGVKVGRSVFFLLGAGFSAAIGFLGMWLATRANVRVAAASAGTARLADPRRPAPAFAPIAVTEYDRHCGGSCTVTPIASFVVWSSAHAGMKLCMFDRVGPPATPPISLAGMMTCSSRNIGPAVRSTTPGQPDVTTSMPVAFHRFG